jgi:hypothetical protein
VLRAKARGHRDVITVVAHAAAIAAGEWITASGEWVNDRTHGQQFKARFLRTSPPTSADGIEKYLSSGMIRHARTKRSPTRRRWRLGAPGTASDTAVDMWTTLTRCPHAHSRNSSSDLQLDKLRRRSERLRSN